MGLFGSSPSPTSTPLPVQEDTTEEDERQKRLEEQVRRRRGRSSTIKTSAKGFLAPTATKKKTLLGE